MSFMATSDNVLEQVTTYNPSLLARLINDNPWIFTANKRFKNFNNMTANLGDSVAYDLPPRIISTSGLVASFQAAKQRKGTLVCDQSENSAYSFTAQQFEFNVKDYMSKFGEAAMGTLGGKIGSNIAECAITDTYRAFDATSGGMTSLRQYAQAIANMHDYGAPKVKAKVYIDLVTVPTVIDNSLLQFATERNNALANSWELGSPSGVPAEFYTTNVLPTHTAGTVGDAGTTLTVTAINAAGTSLTMSGAGVSDDDALKENDILTFDQTNVKKLYFLGFTTYQVTRQKVQVRVTADAGSNGSGVVVATIFPALISDSTNADRNINLGQQTDFIGTTVKAAPSHRAGLITIGDPLFLAMPGLPSYVPFPSATTTDPVSGASLRSYYGNKFGLNEQGYVHDVIWGKKLEGDYSYRIMYPL